MSKRAQDKRQDPDDRQSDTPRPNYPKVTFQQDSASTRAEEGMHHPRVDERAGFTDLTVTPDRNIEKSKQHTALSKQRTLRQDEQRSSTDATEQREALVQVDTPTDVSDSTNESPERSNNAMIKDEGQAKSKESGKKFAKLRSMLTGGMRSQTEPAQPTNQSQLSPEQEFIQHMEHILESNTLSPKSTRLLENALSYYKTNTKYPTIDTAVEPRAKSPTDVSPLHNLQKNQMPSTSAKNIEASRMEPEASKNENRRKEFQSKPQQAPKQEFDPENGSSEKSRLNQSKEIIPSQPDTTMSPESETESSALASAKSKDLPKTELAPDKLTQESTRSILKLPDRNTESINPSEATKTKHLMKKSIKFSPSAHKMETVDPTPGTSKSTESNITPKLPSHSGILQSSLKKSVDPNASSKHHLHFTESTHTQTDPISSRETSSKHSVEPSSASVTFSDSMYNEINKSMSTATSKDTDFETRTPRMTVKEAQKTETDLQDKMKAEEKKFLDDECTLMSFEIDNPFSDFDLRGLTDMAKSAGSTEKSIRPPVGSTKPTQEAESSKKIEPDKKQDKNVSRKVRLDLDAKKQCVDEGTYTETDRINLDLFQGLEAPDSEKKHRVDGNRAEKTGDISGLRSEPDQAEESIESTADASAVQIKNDAPCARIASPAPCASLGSSDAAGSKNLTGVGQTTFEIINPCSCGCTQACDEEQVVQNNPPLFRRFMNYFLRTFIDGSDFCRSSLNIMLADHSNVLPAVPSL